MTNSMQDIIVKREKRGAKFGVGMVIVLVLLGIILICIPFFTDWPGFKAFTLTSVIAFLASEVAVIKFISAVCTAFCSTEVSAEAKVVADIVAPGIAAVTAIVVLI